MFNMGLTRLSKFKKMKAAVDNRDWKEAAVQGRDSRWYNHCLLYTSPSPRDS